MQKLRAGEFSHLNDNVVKVLSQNRISTVLEFIQEDTDKLSTLTKLTLPQVISIRNEIFAKYSPPLVNGSSLLDKRLLSKRYIRTCIPNLDALLNSGIPTGCISEVCGLAGSGKTQLCLQLAINCAKNDENTVLYIDTKGDFSATRIQKVLDACGYSHKEMAHIMFKIRVLYIWTMDEMLELLKRLKTKAIVVERLSLIIIDSLPSLMFQFLGDENKIGLTLLNTFVNYSRYLCKELELGMICVNIQTRWIDQDVADLEDEDGDQPTSVLKDTYIEKRNRCLGKYWQHIPSLIILLEKLDSNDGLVTISIVKLNSLKCNEKCFVKVSDLGVT